MFHRNTTTQYYNDEFFFFQNFTIYRKNNIKRIQNSHKRLATLSLRIQFLSGASLVWIQSFSSPRPATIPILFIAGGRIVGFILFPRILALCEMQTAWSRIWTWATESISYDDNHLAMSETCHSDVLKYLFRSHSVRFHYKLWYKGYL